ncbi:MAG TPA: NAD(P)-dependent alcohol dehydrogenase, partial [Acidobacteriaceae bacterium]|nr:NAD(P)-dependent alcohol dehydrogenase [Acidobacteriaceae bacterium]
MATESIPVAQAHASTTPSSYSAMAYAAQSATSPLAPHTIQRRDPLPNDVQIDIAFCGVCHSDLHFARNEWVDAIPTAYPCVPGHEILGRVTKAGRSVKKFKEGDLAAVGCMVDSCRTCPSCLEGEEQYCQSVPTLTYNAPDKHLGGITYGGYSSSIVVDEAFALKVSDRLDPAGAAPLLCAGVTTYAPLRQWNVQRGQKVGVMGLGGLGHMAVKFAKALGAHVVLFTTSESKAADGARLGADEVVLSKNASEVAKHAGSFHFILDTIPAGHSLDTGLSLLRRDGTLALVGVPSSALSFGAFGLVFGRRKISGSIIGGIRQTQEMLDFCADHNITADVEIISMQEINRAYDRMLVGDVKYRFVIDMASLK